MSIADIERIKIEEYDYPLADQKIAKYPLKERDQSKLLYYNKGNISDYHFIDIPTLLNEGDLLIFNNAKVIQARMYFSKSTGAKIELFCLEPYLPADYNLSFQATESCSWKCMVGNLKKWKSEDLKTTLNVEGINYQLTAQKLQQKGAIVYVKFSWKSIDNQRVLTFSKILDILGKTPLPPYLHRMAEETDKIRYQTVYAKTEGSVAAPTAGLHFTNSILQKLSEKKVHKLALSLHVGAGTFRPVKTDYISEHEMHRERFIVERSFLEHLLKYDGSVIAVGTTSVRSLESIYRVGVKIFQNPEIDHLEIGQWEIYQNEANITKNQAIEALINYMDKKKWSEFWGGTKIMIAPGYKFKMIDGLITNFHQPKSTLLLLIAALIGQDWKKLYQHALENEYRFLSYGDSSLIIPSDRDI